TVFLLSAASRTSLDVTAIQARLNEIGNSVLAGGDGSLVKVHVHNERPDEVIAYGLSLGTLTRITVENLDTMADDVREARAEAFVGDDTASGEDRGDQGSVAVAAKPAVATGARAVEGS